VGAGIALDLGCLRREKLELIDSEIYEINAVRRDHSIESW